jgi:hypothetical protein
MTARLLRLIGGVLVALALLAPPVLADVGDTDLNITQLNVRPDNLQAGGNPNFHLLMRFCDSGIAVDSVTPVPPAPGGPQYRVHTAGNNGVSGFTNVKLVGVRPVTTLSGDIDATTMTIPVASTAGFPSSGTVRIDSEEITYTGTTTGTTSTPPSFTGATRGANSTTAAAHSSGVPVVDAAPPVTTLSGVVDATQPTIPVASTAGFNTSGTLRIDSEEIKYTGTTPTSFTGATRGANSTTAASHLRGASVVDAANGFWVANRVNDNEVDLLAKVSGVPADEVQFAKGLGLSVAPNFGCVAGQKSSFIRQFKLHLPPGFLGNPTAVPACAIPVWQAGLCGPESILGWSFTETIPSANLSLPVFVPTAIFNVATLGLEPARLGTRNFPSDPPGPFPILISLDSTNDYGLNSALTDIPRNLGSAVANPSQIDSVLCAQVPCAPTDIREPSSVQPNPATSAGTPRPFFRNPTSCEPAPASLDASSYHLLQTTPSTTLSADIDAAVTTIPVASTADFPSSGTLQLDFERINYTGTTPTTFTGATRGAGSTPAAAHGNGTRILALKPTSSVDISVPDHYPNDTDDASTSTFTPTGCDQVPFDPSKDDIYTRVDAAPTADAEHGQPDPLTGAGAAGAQKVTISYCNGALPDPCPYNYADEQIWPSMLRDAYVTLPEGMTLSPAGGIGLESCTAAEFGVNPATGKQINNDPVTCPAGSQIGTIKVHTPVLTQELGGTVFFGPVSGPGRPDESQHNPWKLYLLIEGAGLRLKLVGDTTVSAEGQIKNVFLRQPNTPFDKFELTIRGGDRAVLANPTDCNPHTGGARLVGWADNRDPNKGPVVVKESQSTPTVTPTDGCDPKPFAPSVDDAGADPEDAGANTVSRIVMSRSDGQPDIKKITLSLPVGAVGSLAAAPQCPIAVARAGDCSPDSKVGTVKTTVGTGDALLTVAGSLYLAEGEQPDDAATLALVVPAKVGPIDLGQVVVINHIKLRATDTGINAITEQVPNVLEGVPLHVRRIQITVDREGFFLNPTGCDARPLTATFEAYDGQVSTSTKMLAAKNCGRLPFNPRLTLTAGAKGLTKTGVHPPLKAVVTQKGGEANILNSKVVLPDILRPNAVQFNAPGGLCSDAQFAVRACPKPSLVGNARVITPVLPFQLRGPVYVVQETGSILPKLYVDLKGKGIEVILRARNSFQGIRTVNTFDGLPDVPQAYFELNINGGNGGILNAFNDLCKATPRPFDVSFTGQNGKVSKSKPHLKVDGCVKASGVGASIASNTVRVSRKGIAKINVSCRDKKACKGSLSLKGIGSKSFRIKASKRGAVKIKVSKKGMRKLRKAKRLKTRATAKVGSKTSRKTLTLIAPKRRR